MQGILSNQLSVLPFITLLVYIVDQWKISSSLHPFDIDRNFLIFLYTQQQVTAHNGSSAINSYWTITEPNTPAGWLVLSMSIVTGALS